MIHTRDFGKYQVKVNDKTLKVSILYLWGEKDKEVFKSDITPYMALCWLRDFGFCSRLSSTYMEAKDYLLKFIEKEF